jgi:uncharacterized coiled-coil DUF342 family protein
MKNRILLIIFLLLIGTSCAKEKEEKAAADNAISERLEIIDRARAARQKQNEAVERRNQLIEDIAKGHRKESGDGSGQHPE